MTVKIRRLLAAAVLIPAFVPDPSTQVVGATVAPTTVEVTTQAPEPTTTPDVPEPTTVAPAPTTVAPEPTTAPPEPTRSVRPTVRPTWSPPLVHPSVTLSHSWSSADATVSAAVSPTKINTIRPVPRPTRTVAPVPRAPKTADQPVKTTATAVSGVGGWYVRQEERSGIPLGMLIAGTIAGFALLGAMVTAGAITVYRRRRQDEDDDAHFGHYG